MFLICSETRDAFCDRSPIDLDCAESYRRAMAKISCVGPEKQGLAVAAKKCGAL